MNNFVSGFKEFISKGNAIDLAVGVVIGAAFGAVVTALMEGFVSPLIAALFGQPSLDKVWNFTINNADFSIGKILTAVLMFVLTALAVYSLVVVPINKLRSRNAVEEVAATPEDIALLTEIRDLLKK